MVIGKGTKGTEILKPGLITTIETGITVDTETATTMIMEAIEIDLTTDRTGKITGIDLETKIEDNKTKTIS